MMREPTSRDAVYAWHKSAMGERVLYKGDNIARIGVTDEPQAGWFKTELVRKGTLVPARIWLEQPIDEETGELSGDEVMRCEVDGEPRDPDQQWLFLCKRPISEREFAHMTGLRRWQRINAPDEYDAARRPVDHMKTPILEE